MASTLKTPVSSVELRRTAARLIVAASGVCAAVLLTRHGADEVPQSPPAWVACVATSLLLGLNLSACWLALRRDGDEAWWGGALAGPVLIGLAFAGNSAGALAYVIGLAIAGMIGVVTFPWRESVSSSAGGHASSVAPDAVAARDQESLIGETVVANAAAEEIGACGVEAEALDDADVTQRLVRRSCEGAEILDGFLRVAFEPGQRQAHVHVPLWPAFAAIPEVECEPLDDADVGVRITAAQTFGVRLEVRLAKPAERALSVPIGVQITSPASAGSAEAA